ncbi:hypothetical protein M427DRAFT_30619 [Gonapodya prolifera JEL478]|uniref:Uncharacterized protein n=1 Tax=Gonapodya prolifera (strain JEL478) TaxID=1344416 RepID=A0A139AKC6_GONPJ|nr:hypothetical protein M427DRAFT_30619 [Gonapodya prolifera JEL478]|eukprot:KXS17148.1 hypothetical protein M427DRAFT_30619 [Gonapodya prolifera JEL478]
MSAPTSHQPPPSQLSPSQSTLISRPIILALRRPLLVAPSEPGLRNVVLSKYPNVHHGFVAEYKNAGVPEASKAMQKVAEELKRSFSLTAVEGA